MNQITQNLHRVKQRITDAAQRSGRLSDSIRLIAVTKGVNASQIQTIITEGVTDIGENRIQEAQQKYNVINQSKENSTQENNKNYNCKWHLIGHLQRNKVKPAVEMFSLIHSVDSIRLYKEISNRSRNKENPTRVLLQVNTTGEVSKFGIAADEVLSFVEEVHTYPNVEICGLMTIGILSVSPEDNRPAFQLLMKLSENIEQQQFSGVNMQYLSMGMTNDFEIAIEEGANLVRIGTAIFGTDN